MHQLDKGVLETDLSGVRDQLLQGRLWAHAFILVNKFKLFPQPNICFCDAFYQLSL